MPSKSCTCNQVATQNPVFPTGRVSSSPTPKSAALPYHNGTTTPCFSLTPLSLRKRSIADKGAVLSPWVHPYRPLSLSGSGYESEGRRFESCRARPKKPHKSPAFAFLAGPLCPAPTTRAVLVD